MVSVLIIPISIHGTFFSFPQASWVCQCDVALVDRLEEDFKSTLQQQNSLEQWAEWLQAVVSQVLRPYEGKVDFPKHARQFLLKWSFYRLVYNLEVIFQVVEQ